MRLSDRPIVYSLLFVELGVAGVLAFNRNPFSSRANQLERDYPAIITYARALNERDRFVKYLKEETPIRKYDAVTDEGIVADLEQDRTTLKNFNSNLNNIMDANPNIEIRSAERNSAVSHQHMWYAGSVGIGVIGSVLLTGTLANVRLRRLERRISKLLD